MMRSDVSRFEALVVLGARPGAAMHGYAWRQMKHLSTIAATGTNSAHGLPGAPT
jgi:hypothetical protein